MCVYLQNAVDPSMKGSFLPFDQSELMRHFRNISLKSLKIKSTAVLKKLLLVAVQRNN